tara:strand:+ start:2638 stop:3201 length:564 start_codon:yes stop_codon:yes gene_type:complete
MKIISGSLKGRKIETNSKLNYRPTLSRIREDVFNILAHNNLNKSSFGESIFADLCCGSGSIGIEALSRGCKHCYFNDVDNEQIKKISTFLKINTNFNYNFTNFDLTNLTSQIQWEKFDIIYLDPPYKIKIEPIILNNINRIKNETIIITETNYAIFSNLEPIHSKNYKNKYIRFYKGEGLKKFKPFE